MRDILPLIFLLESLILLTKATASASSFSSTTTFCLQPDVPENCHVIFAQPGPYQPGSDERKCAENGQWTGVAPLCAIDVAANKPAEQSSGQSTAQNAVLSLPNCALTDSSKSSWWSVNLLGSFDIRAISITLGHLSSELVDIRMETSNGTMSSCAREVSNLKNSTNRVYIFAQ
uniref:Sushi domain-containing protein n=1 Tax=Panagrolaimus superbus TaxID=310955 RepID=A0A914XUR2_9BILA